MNGEQPIGPLYRHSTAAAIPIATYLFLASPLPAALGSPTDDPLAQLDTHRRPFTRRLISKVLNAKLVEAFEDAQGHSIHKI